MTTEGWKFVVLDDENVQSTNADSEPESFFTYEAAHVRAERLAEENPGEEYKIYEQVAAVTAQVSAAVTVINRPGLRS